MRKRKAISEIISVVIILLIVSVAGVILFNVSLQTTSAQQSSLREEIDRETAAAQERFKIIGVEYINNYTMNAYLLNYANKNTIDISISEIYINGIKTSKFGDLKIASGDIGTITIISPIKLLSSSDPSRPVYTILVVSERGVGATYVWSIPNKID